MTSFVPSVSLGGFPNVTGNDNINLPSDYPHTAFPPATAGGTSPNGGQGDNITADGSAPHSATFASPFRTALGTTYSNVTNELFEITDYRYLGCYGNQASNPSFGSAATLWFGKSNGVYLNTSWTPHQCARLCWNDTKTWDPVAQNTANTTAYRNWRYFAVTGNPVSGHTRCYCGPQIQTAKLSPEFCWGPLNTSHHRQCTGSDQYSCGGDTAALVFVRADLEGGCDTNSTGALDHQWWVTTDT